MKPFTATTPLARKLIVPVGLAFVVLCAVPKPAHAIFGLGDIVYDPTNWGEAVKQLEQDIKLVEQGIQTYNLLQSELRMLQQRPWEIVATTLSNIQIPISANGDNADDDDG